MYFNLFIRQQSYPPVERYHYLIWDAYRSKKAAKAAVKYFTKRYYTYVKTIHISNFDPDDDTTMTRFPVTSYCSGRINYDR